MFTFGENWQNCSYICNYKCKLTRQNFDIKLQDYFKFIFCKLANSIIVLV